MKANRSANDRKIVGTCRLTKHGRQRLQARAIPEEAVDYVMNYGVEQRTHGASRFFLDQETRRNLQRGEGRTVLDRLGHKLDIVVVVGADDCLVTAKYRTKRLFH